MEYPEFSAPLGTANDLVGRGRFFAATPGKRGGAKDLDSCAIFCGVPRLGQGSAGSVAGEGPFE